MKKSIIKNLLAITFALGALVFVAGNVFADHTDALVDEIEDQEGGGTGFICWQQGTYQRGDSHRSCYDCKTVFHSKPNYNTQGRCIP